MPPLVRKFELSKLKGIFFNPERFSKLFGVD